MFHDHEVRGDCSPLCFNISCYLFIVVDFVLNLYALMDPDIKQIILEAQHRWLRPAEICAILGNYKKFRIAPEPAHMPPSMISLPPKDNTSYLKFSIASFGENDLKNCFFILLFEWRWGGLGF